MHFDWVNLNSQMVVASGDEQGVRWSVVATVNGAIVLNVGGDEISTLSGHAHLVSTMNVAEGLLREMIERRLQVPKIVVQDVSGSKMVFELRLTAGNRTTTVRQQMPTDTIYVSDDKDFEYALFTEDRTGAERLAAILALCPPTNCAATSKTDHTLVMATYDSAGKADHTLVRTTYDSAGKAVLVAEVLHFSAFYKCLTVRCAKTRKTLFSLSVIGCTAAGIDRLVAALFLLLTEDRFAQTRKDLNLG